jgi:hypothetical protein
MRLLSSVGALWAPLALSSVAGFAILLVDCAPSAVTVRPSAHAAPTATQASSVAEGSKRPTAHTRQAFPERRPELGITTPMRGEPSDAALTTESRLAAATCETVTNDTLEPRLKAMRAAVDQSFKDWHDGQPECWRGMREEYMERKRLEAFGNMWGDAIGDSFGAGGLGLTGVGEGGGGRGEGIGLGSIGTIGHGAGTGSGASFGRGASSGAATTRAATKSSGTNNQVVGVDEADLVKTDGRYVYLATQGALRIIEALSPKMISETRLPGTVREMFVEGDRAVVYVSQGTVGKRCTYGYDCEFSGDGTTTKVLVFDISKREHPVVVRDLGMSGSLVTARRIGNAIHTVVADNDKDYTSSYATWPSGLDMCGTTEKVVRTKFAQLKLDNERLIRAKAVVVPTMSEKGKTQPLCAGLLRTPMRDGQAFTTVVSFDLTNDSAAPTTAVLQSRPGAVFASSDALYVAVTHRKNAVAGRRWFSYYSPNVDEVSEIHKFRIGKSPSETRYVGSGSVPGHVLNQFAMDEWYGYLRVATTKGRVPDSKVASVVSVLTESSTGNLVRVGAIDNIAPGEDIRAVRFEEDRGYVVTFKKTDPLFVMDLFQPARPKILGELKIPGFSTYMHRIDPDHLLSIGVDANDHGDFAYFDGVILQLFDVKNPTQPKLVHKEKIGTRGSSSEAVTDHLAFNYFASEGLLAIPMTICEGGGDGRNGDDLAFSGLLVYDVDVERGFTRLGGVDHGTKGASCQAWWSNASSVVKRSVFLDDLVYSIASDRVKVQNMNHFGVDLASFSLVAER